MPPQAIINVFGNVSGHVLVAQHGTIAGVNLPSVNIMSKAKKATEEEPGPPQTGPRADIEAKGKSAVGSIVVDEGEARIRAEGESNVAGIAVGTKAHHPRAAPASETPTGAAHAKESFWKGMGGLIPAVILVAAGVVVTGWVKGCGPFKDSASATPATPTATATASR